MYSVQAMAQTKAIPILAIKAVTVSVMILSFVVILI